MVVSSADEQNPAVVTFVIDGKSSQLPYQVGKTILEVGLDGGLFLPSSCRLGYCASCMARVTEGKVEMRENHALTEAEVAAGYVLVCQSIPVTPTVIVEYE